MNVTPTDYALENSLRIFLRLLDLSRDLERNEDDARFRTEGGEIFYLFDADLFEVFVHPDDGRGRSASLHDQIWAFDRLPSPTREHWKSIAAQTALSATEYLVSGTLPGQRAPNILMTHEHRWELARRTGALANNFAIVLGNRSPEKSLARFARVGEFRNQVKDSSDWAQTRAVDPLLYEDVEALRADGIPTNELANFVGARAALAALVEDQTIEPAEQLQRIVGPPLRRRLITLHQQFPIPPEDDREVIADANIWFQRLLDEANRQRVQVVDSPTLNVDGRPEKSGRSRAALWDDARSLATARWIASRHMNGRTRLVYITADQLVFDAFRRWYSNLDPSVSAYAEPFLLRRLTQYAPMFNLTDARKLSGGKARAVFEDLKHLLEVNLLALNLSRLSARSAAEPILVRMRELSALRAKDPEPISSDPLYASLAEAVGRKLSQGEMADMRVILDDLRKLERVALGQFDQHVGVRVGESESRALGLMQNPDSQLIVKYLGGLIHKMLAVSLKVWLPLAREFIDAWRPPEGDMLIRAPVTVRLEVDDGRRILDIDEALKRKLDRSGDNTAPLLSSDDWARVIDDEALVFGIAAVLALASADWTNAQHFAEMAQKAHGSSKGRGDDRLSEYKYLAAISKRFLIGQYGPPKRPAALARLIRMYSSAEDNINWSVKYHEARDTSTPQPLRLLRSLSERAALRLFFTSALTPAVRDALEAKVWREQQAPNSISTNSFVSILGQSAEERAIKCLGEAEADLRRCLEIDEARRSTTSFDRRGAIETIRRQYLANICSAAVARKLLNAPGGDEKLSPKDPRLTESIKAFAAKHAKSSHGVMRAETLGFIFLSGDLAAAEQIGRMEKLPHEALALDRALFTAVQKTLASEQ